MSNMDWNAHRGDDYYDKIMEGCDGEEIARKKKHKDRRVNKHKKDRRLPKRKDGAVYNGHVGTWVYEHSGKEKKKAQGKEKNP